MSKSKRMAYSLLYSGKSFLCPQFILGAGVLQERRLQEMSFLQGIRRSHAQGCKE
jgi:hypothetical protein